MKLTPWKMYYLKGLPLFVLLFVLAPLSSDPKGRLAVAMVCLMIWLHGFFFMAPRLDR